MAATATATTSSCMSLTCSDPDRIRTSFHYSRRINNYSISSFHLNNNNNNNNTNTLFRSISHIPKPIRSG
ncbi:hypothetical protein RYX36_027480, partial [Vicia faba]